MSSIENSKYARLQAAIAASGLSEVEYLARAAEAAKAEHASRLAADRGNGDRRKPESPDPDSPVKDYGHAAVLAEHFRGRYRWAAHRGSWMSWSGQVWRPVEEERVAKVAADTLRAEYAGQLVIATTKFTIRALTALVRETCIYARITGALSFLKGWDGILTRFEEWDADPWALNVGSGIIAPTGEGNE